MVVEAPEKLDQKELFRRHSYWAHNSLYYLNKFVLFKLAKNQMTPEPHERVCDFIQFWRKGCSRKLLFMSRKSFKTSDVSVGDPIFDLINDPNDTILILAQERGYAMTILGQIKRQMEENEELIAINGRDFKGSGSWKEFEIFINGRTDWVSKEPSIGTAGIDSVKAGPHPRKIILDDPETEDNTSSLEACEKLLENYRMLSPMLKQGGHMIVIGTPYAFEGIYYYILENPAELRSFDILIGQARKDSGILPKISKFFIHLPEGPEGTLLMPNVLTEEYLDDEEAKDPPFFAGQYMLSLSSGGAAEFKREWFRYYLEKELPEKLKNYVLLDPAISQKSTADYTCIKVISQDVLNNIFIRKMIHARLEPDEVIEYFYKFFFDYHPFKMGIETNGMQYLFKWQFDKEAKFRGRLPIFELKHYGKLTKKARIRALIAPYKEGRIYHLAGNKEKTRVHPEQRILESQLLHWNPKKKMHDDAADTLAMFLELATPRKKRKGRRCPRCGAGELFRLRSGEHQCSQCLHIITLGYQIADKMTGY